MNTNKGNRMEHTEKLVPKRKTDSLRNAMAVAAMKGRYLDQWTRPNQPVYAKDYLERAGEEAASIAWSTGYPLLFFPVLFEEMAREARLQAFKQNEIRAKSRELNQILASRRETALDAGGSKG